MAVISMHFSATMQSISSSKFPSLAPHGELAVDIFFVLSGFILGYTYLESFNNQPFRFAYSDFLKRRFARIFPLNVAVVTAITLSAWAAFWLAGWSQVTRARPHSLAADFISNSLMLPGIGIGHSINWPAWSVSVEFLGYFLFPLFLLGLFHRRVGVLLMTCGGAISLIVLICLSNPELSPDGIHSHEFLPWRDIARFSSEFLLGLATFRVYESGRLRAIFEGDATSVAIIGLAMAIVLLRIGDLFAIILFPPLVLALSLNNGLVAEVMSMRLPRFLGTISYSLYLVHDNFRPVAAALVRAIHPTPIPPLAGLGLAALFSSAMILPAWGCYTWVERPGRAMFRGKLWSGTRIMTGRYQ